MRPSLFPLVALCLTLSPLPRATGDDAPPEALVLLRKQFLEGPGAYEAYCRANEKTPRAELRKTALGRMRALAEESRAQLSEFLKAHPELEVGQWLHLVNAFHVRGPAASLDLLATRPEVASVLRDDTRFLLTPFEPDPADGEAPPAVSPPADPPFDTAKLEVPWNLQDCGARRAWADGVTGKGILVAVIDPSLLCLTAPCLEGAVWRNPGEVPDNGKDDDGNGFVDDVHGWDFWRRSPRIHTPKTTHALVCAGILLGRECGTTVTGVAPRARLLHLRCSEGGHLEALQYALDQGADVVSMSFMFEMPPSGRAVLRLAAEQASCAGMVLGGGAGNNGKKRRGVQIQSPKDVPCVLCVSGVTQDLKPHEASSRGPVTWEDVPPYRDFPLPEGPRKPDLCAFLTGYLMQGAKGPDPDGKAGGNSFSGPHVLGAAALMLEAHPGLKPWQVRGLLCRTARDLLEPGWDPVTGWGLLDVAAAVGEARKTP